MSPGTVRGKARKQGKETGKREEVIDVTNKKDSRDKEEPGDSEGKHKRRGKKRKRVAPVSIRRAA